MPLQYTLPELKIQTLAANSRCLVRCDLNVPHKYNQETIVATDHARIEIIAPMIKQLSAAGHRVILVSHFGRPKGKIDKRYSLEFLVDVLNKHLQQPVDFATDIEHAGALIPNMQPGGILLLENIRFYEGEESNDPLLAQQLAQLGDVYINDAFSTSHRAHASVAAITKYLPKYAGYHLNKEFHTIRNAIKAPQRPLGVIISGAKISTKLPIMRNLLPQVDYMMVGGGIASTIFAALGRKMRLSLVEKDMCAQLPELVEHYKDKLILPLDYMAAPIKQKNEQDNPIYEICTGDLKPKHSMFGIGPATVQLYKEIISRCKCLIWNGPLSYCENKTFASPTIEIAQHVGQCARNNDLYSIVGGGETIAAVRNAKVENNISYMSTAGGAFIDLCAGTQLPGIQALID